MGDILYKKVMKGIRSFYNVINLCIGNKENFIYITKESSSLVLCVIKLLKSKGFVQVFQKD